MELLSKRKIFLTTRTVADLYIAENVGAPVDNEQAMNFRWFCYIEEDTVREPNEFGGRWTAEEVAEWKIPHVTAIPSGRYEIVLENSPKFGPDTLTIKDVPGFDYIRFHSGNTEDDTDGCQVQGYGLTPDCTIKPGTTHPAVEDLKKLAKEAVARGERIFITIENCWPKEVS